MHRFFSSFLTGWPAVGLLLLRLAVTVGVFSRNPAAHLVERGAALLVLLGFSTPVCGVSVALFELKRIAGPLDAARASTLLATIGISLALLGPGAWSVDARLFGLRRISIPPPRKRNGQTRSS